MSMFSDLNAEAYDRQYSDRELVRRIARHLSAQLGRVLLTIVYVLILAGIGAAEPVLVAWGIDRVAERQTLGSIFLFIVLLLQVGLVWWLLRWTHRRVVARLVGDVVQTLQNDAFFAVVGHDLSFHDQNSSGRIVSRITSDTESFSQLAEMFPRLFSQIFEALILLVILLRINWRLGIWVLGIVPAVLVLALGFRLIARRVNRRGMQAIADVNNSVKESIAGISVTKNFHREEEAYAEFSKINGRSYSANLVRGLAMNMIFPVFTGIGGCGVALIVYQGAQFALAGTLSIGSWYLFFQSLERFMYPMLQLSSFWPQVQTGLAAAERIFALIDAEPTVLQNNCQVPETLSGEIKFDHVAFHYREEEPVLSDFSLTIHPGETVAFVGHTGAGKTSIARLVSRFYEFQQGRITVDGRDIRDLDLHAYREQLGIVPQTPFLFSGTVLDNIRYGKQSATREEIETLAHKIGEGDWLDALPDGLDSSVGERGNQLSMGQRQLVALVRVLVRQPAFFILDEATANIDPFTERQIQDAIELILKQTTSILIAHRLSTVRAADQIVVLKAGQIIEKGSHDKLLATGGHYAELYNTYFRHQSLEYIDSR